MRVRAAATCLLFAATITACAGDDGDDDIAREEVVTAVVRDVVAGLPPGEDPDDRPVVYVLPVGEQEIAATVQADVAEALVDDVDVRFADERAEAVEGDEPNEPVHDDGVLVGVGDLPESGPVEVVVEIYRDAREQSRVVYTFGRESSEWRITATSLLAQG
jgi:hypothetical protein